MNWEIKKSTLEVLPGQKYFLLQNFIKNLDRFYKWNTVDFFFPLLSFSKQYLVAELKYCMPMIGLFTSLKVFKRGLEDHS